MANRDVNRILYLGLFLLTALSGCTNATPDVSFLNPNLKFQFLPSALTTSSMHSVTLFAECSSFIDNIQMSFDNGATWISPTSYDVAAKSKCENGKFAITLTDTKAPWNSVGFTNGQVVAVKFRATARIGNPVIRSVNILFSPSATISQEILVGASAQTGTGLRMKSRLRALQQTISSGGGYVMQGRITQ
jgi:hypothetical protein